MRCRCCTANSLAVFLHAVCMICLSQNNPKKCWRFVVPMWENVDSSFSTCQKSSKLPLFHNFIICETYTQSNVTFLANKRLAFTDTHDDVFGRNDNWNHVGIWELVSSLILCENAGAGTPSYLSSKICVRSLFRKLVFK